MKAIKALILSLALVFSPALRVTADVVTPPPSTDGVVTILNNARTHQICTAAIIKKIKDVYYGVTAKHCLKGGVPDSTVRWIADPKRLKWYGRVANIHYANDRDFAMFAFRNERTDGLKYTGGIAELSDRMPKPGERIWGIGVLPWDNINEKMKQALVLSPGVYVGSKLETRRGFERHTNLFVAPGESGGPIFVDGKVFAVYSSVYAPHGIRGYEMFSGVATVPALDP